MRQIYNKLPKDAPLDIKLLAAVFDHQGQCEMSKIKKYIIENDINTFSDPNKCERTIRASLANHDVRSDDGNIVRINVDGFNKLKDYCLDNIPNEKELTIGETIVTIIENVNIPKLSKLASKIHRKKIQYMKDLETMGTCVSELDRILDKYSLTTQPLSDEDGDLGVEDKELIDTAKVRADMERWKNNLPKTLKLAFKLQLRKYGDDKVLASVLNEIYNYEKWQLSQSIDKEIN